MFEFNNFCGSEREKFLVAVACSFFIERSDEAIDSAEERRRRFKARLDLDAPHDSPPHHLQAAAGGPLPRRRTGPGWLVRGVV